jgi:hypothetical protein
MRAIILEQAALCPSRQHIVSKKTPGFKVLLSLLGR